MSFNDFKKKSKSNMTDLIRKMEDQNKKTDYKDDRFWRPEIDKTGNGFAIIRFLPEVENEDCPWAKVYSHAFRGPGGWYIENCLTTISQKDPVSEYNSTLWNSGIEANKEIARKQKRRLNYIANVYVVSDPSNPENEGQIRIYKFGKKIFDKITEAMNPEFADETPVNPFDLWEGANFKLKIRNVEGYRNYDKSEFADKSALFEGDDAKLEELWKKEFSLKEFTEKSQFKPYEQLKSRLEKVLGFGGEVARTKAESAVLDSPFKDDSDIILDKSNVEDEDLDYFKSLAEAK